MFTFYSDLISEMYLLPIQIGQDYGYSGPKIQLNILIERKIYTLFCLGTLYPW